MPSPTASRGTNGFSVASLVCSIVGVFFFAVPSVLGVIFGFVALHQIKESGGLQGGRGMALAGVIVGFVVVGLAILGIVLLATLGGGRACFGTGNFCQVHGYR